MQKQAPTAGRLLVMVGFALSCFGLLLFLWVAFGGPTPLKARGYRFHASFGEATQLAQEADVRISGVSVGKVKTIDPDKKTGRSEAVIELKPQYAPLPKDSKAILRQKTLLGETYVELSPGHSSAGFIPENGTMPASQVSPTVELDEIFRAFPPKTRADFQNWMQQQAIGLKGRGQDLNDALGDLGPFATDASRILEILQSQSGAVRRLVRNTGTVFDALSERDGQLRSLIQNSNRVFATTAQRNQALQQAFVALPTFENEARNTVNRLTTFSKQTNPLVTQLRPSARELSPTLTDLSKLAPDLKALFRDLDPVITASKKGLPATQRFLDELHPVLTQFDPVAKQLNPILDFVGQYKPELGAFFGNTVAATEATSIPPGGDVNTKVHYLRTTNPINLENLAVYPTVLPTNRSNPYQQPGAFRNLKDGLPVYDAKSCELGVLPSFGGTVNQLLELLPQTLLDQLKKTLSSASGAVAPPCRQQKPFTTSGKATQFPQIVPNGAGLPESAKAK